MYCRCFECSIDIRDPRQAGKSSPMSYLQQQISGGPRELGDVGKPPLHPIGHPATNPARHRSAEGGLDWPPHM